MICDLHDCIAAGHDGSNEMEPPTIRMKAIFEISVMIDFGLTVIRNAQFYEETTKLRGICRLTTGRKVEARIAAAQFRRTVSDLGKGGACQLGVSVESPSAKDDLIHRFARARQQDSRYQTVEKRSSARDRTPKQTP